MQAEGLKWIVTARSGAEEVVEGHLGLDDAGNAKRLFDLLNVQHAYALKRQTLPYGRRLRDGCLLPKIRIGIGVRRPAIRSTWVLSGVKSGSSCVSLVPYQTHAADPRVEGHLIWMTSPGGAVS